MTFKLAERFSSEMIHTIRFEAPSLASEGARVSSAQLSSTKAYQLPTSGHVERRKWNQTLAATVVEFGSAQRWLEFYSE